MSLKAFQLLHYFRGIMDTETQPATTQISHFAHDQAVHIRSKSCELFVTDHVAFFLCFDIFDVGSQSCVDVFQGFPYNGLLLGIVEGEQCALMALKERLLLLGITDGCCVAL